MVGLYHGRLADDDSCVEGHGQALARPLGVPDDPDTMVTRRSTRFAASLVPSPFIGNLRSSPLPTKDDSV